MNYKRPLILLLLLAALLLAACAAPVSSPTPTQDTDAPTPPIPAPPATLAAAAGPSQTWSAMPEMSIDPAQTYLATLKTAKGEIVVELYADKAPLTVNSFIFLARQGFYDNTTFHRVLDDFMAQGGDPTGNGGGGPGYTIPDEFDPDLTFDRAGLLAMANIGAPNSGGSQFFITFAPVPWLDGYHTIFGEVISGMDVLDQLTRRDPETNPDFPGDALITVEIAEGAVSQRATPTPAPTPFAPDAQASDHFMAAISPAERDRYFNTAPDLALTAGQIYFATFRLPAGEIVVELFPDLAPANVNSFMALANAGYYDGLTFYQVIEELVAVGGDPLGDGNGSAGYTLPEELQLGAFDAAGWLGSAQQGVHAAGQFFFTLGPTPWLAERFTPIGRVVAGEALLAQITPRDPSSAPADQPGDPIQSVTISTGQASRLPTPTPLPEPLSPALPSGDERPLAALDPEARNSYYNTAPALQIDIEQDYIAVIRTAVGDITVDLFEKSTPNTVNNFVLLALNGFYDGTSFHRVIEDFMAQGGDPSGTGGGGPGYQFADEFNPELRHDRAGLLSMANAGAGTNGSQFFITFAATPWLDDRHTLFGEVIEGMDVLAKIERRDPATAATPGTAITRIDIEIR